VETDVSNEWFGHGVEKTIVNNDYQRSDNVVTLRELCISYVVLADLLTFSINSSIVFVADNKTLQLIRKLINSIRSVIFISYPESTCFVFVVAKAGQCSIDIISSCRVEISGFIEVLPCVICFFLVLDFRIMWNFRLCSLNFFLVSFWIIIVLLMFID
jgi:hypothetical protein